MTHAKIGVPLVRKEGVRYAFFAILVTLLLAILVFAEKREPLGLKEGFGIIFLALLSAGLWYVTYLEWTDRSYRRQR